MRGKRDEGMLIISAYRVCQDTNSRAGAFTAYHQQYTMLREAGHARPNPCQQILTDIQALIDSKRKEGYRPILMLDANGDIHNPKKPDIGMQEFIQRTNLIDAYHQKFHDSPHTYMWGTKRLDYILVDSVLTQAIERIGYLGMHEGAETNHAYAYMDLNDKAANQGTVHRPIATKSRDFVLAQSDKVKNFLDKLVPSAKCEN